MEGLIFGILRYAQSNRTVTPVILPSVSSHFVFFFFQIN